MKTLKLSPEQIITLNDYPLYDTTVMLKYFKKCISGKSIPYVPVIDKDIVIRYFPNNVLKNFRAFQKSNNKAKYFLVDGSHRTTAATLAKRKIDIIVYESDKDITEAKKLLEKGKMIINGTLDLSLEENCLVLSKHFALKAYFMTVEQKTHKLIEDKVVTKQLLHEALHNENL